MERPMAYQAIPILNDNGFTEQEAYDLEGLIDRRVIQMVLQKISQICGLKADHIAHDWQNTGLARRWGSDHENYKPTRPPIPAR